MPDLKEILQRVASGKLTPEAALSLLPPREENLGFARVDTDRLRRRGLSEVIFCPGKTTGQLVEIVRALADAGQNVLATRATQEQFDAVHAEFPDAQFHAHARAITLDVTKLPARKGLVAVVCELAGRK